MFMKELAKVRNPLRVFMVAYRIWFPKNWVIKRYLYGEAEVIPTIVVNRAAPTQHSQMSRDSVDGEVSIST